jgi:hypothetical protein
MMASKDHIKSKYADDAEEDTAEVPPKKQNTIGINDSSSSSSSSTDDYSSEPEE